MLFLKDTRRKELLRGPNKLNGAFIYHQWGCPRQISRKQPQLPVGLSFKGKKSKRDVYRKQMLFTEEERLQFDGQVVNL